MRNLRKRWQHACARRSPPLVLLDFRLQLDRLAREGSIVHQAYAPHALCAPARAALLTGRLVSRLAGSTDVDQQAAAIALQRAAARGTTIATRLREQHAFATGFFGKWHLAPLPFVEQYLCSWGGIVEWNATMYDIVKRSVHDAGFEVAEALFPCNLPTMTRTTLARLTSIRTTPSGSCRTRCAS